MAAGRPSVRVRRQAGFTYLGLIVLVTIIGLVGAATLKADALLRRAAAEQELLEIGAAFSAALTSYAEATPRGQPTQPPSLEDLLKDPRFPGARRHLRKIFVDPITGKAEWGIVWLNKGGLGGGGGGSGVVAVYSLSDAKPFKQANFDTRFQNFEKREHLSDWKFGMSGQGVAQGQPGQPGQPGQFGQFGQAGAPPAQFLPPASAAEPGAGAQQPAENPPSLFPGRGNPSNMIPSPVEPPVPPPQPEPAQPQSVPPADAAPEPVEPPPPSEASGAGEEGKDESDANRR
jgi:type II secretory pathway pseudopilin PulG